MYTVTDVTVSDLHFMSIWVKGGIRDRIRVEFVSGFDPYHRFTDCAEFHRVSSGFSGFFQNMTID